MLLLHLARARPVTAPVSSFWQTLRPLNFNMFASLHVVTHFNQSQNLSDGSAEQGDILYCSTHTLALTEFCSNFRLMMQGLGQFGRGGRCATQLARCFATTSSDQLAAIKSLRERSSAPMSDVRAALLQTNWKMGERCLQRGCKVTPCTR